MGNRGWVGAAARLRRARAAALAAYAAAGWLAGSPGLLPASALAAEPAAARAAGPAPAPAPARTAEPTPAELDRLALDSRARWQASRHGEWLVRILPERLTPSQLPEPASRGARLTGLYCVQCHNLPNPAMHDAERWPKVVQRMLPRMQGKGNMGALMSEMMLGPGQGAAPRALAAPSPEETAEIVAYLQRHAQRDFELAATPAMRAAIADSGRGRMFADACSQCHALPDPRRHRASEWPRVVSRMQENMAWMNRVVGTRRDPREPQLRPEEIVAFLQQHARR